MSRVLNAEGADNGLDVGVSLLTFGLLPQRVLLHGEAGDPDPGNEATPSSTRPPSTVLQQPGHDLPLALLRLRGEGQQIFAFSK